MCEMQANIDELRARMDASIVEPNKKSDLEILEQNIDDEDKNNYWYWNGETWK